MIVFKYVFAVVALLGGGLTIKNTIALGKNAPRWTMPLAYSSAFSLFCFSILSLLSSGGEIKKSVEAICSLAVTKQYCEPTPPKVADANIDKKADTQVKAASPVVSNSKAPEKATTAKKALPGVASFGISIRRRELTIVSNGQIFDFKVAIPTESAAWTGRTTIVKKLVNPVWVPSPELIKNNPKLPAGVPGGHPMNPLGVRALVLANGHRITGTDAPWTIGQAIDTEGDFRLSNDDVIKLFTLVEVGTEVEIFPMRSP